MQLKRLHALLFRVHQQHQEIPELREAAILVEGITTGYKMVSQFLQFETARSQTRSQVRPPQGPTSSTGAPSVVNILTRILNKRSQF